MKLKSFGCSFIYGNELEADSSQVSDQTWPALLAQHMDLDYHCYAEAGAGNLRILQQLLDQIATLEPAVYVIGWTWIDRFDYVDCANDQWATLRPTTDTDVAQNYYRNLHSQYRDKFTTLLNIRTAVDALYESGAPFIMTYMDDLIFETKWHTSPALLDCQQYVAPAMKNFEGQTFLNWSRSQGYPVSDLFHPLHQAHRAAADYIISQKW